MRWLDPAAPCLLFLTTLYNHYLLLTPDDEFFSDTSSKPISLDEVLELAGIWRDLAFWGYMNGLAPSGSASGKSPGTEEARALFTRGVTRVAERKWVFSSMMAEQN
jgi:ubiquitin-protein ligase E3 C